jgi:phosphatidate cytidylyltransferase
VKDFWKRTLATVIASVSVMLLLIWAFQPVVQYIVAIVCAALAAVAAWEYGQLARTKGNTNSYVLVPLVAAVVLAFFAAARMADNKWPLFMLFLAALILFGVRFRQKQGAIVDLAVSLFGLLYVAVPFGMMLWILYSQSGEDGRIWIAYLIAVTKITDIGGYFFGSLWGQRKLAPNISPGKTVEGALLGWVCAVAVSLLFYGIGRFTSQFHLELIDALWLGALLGIVGQFGDLAESLLKRDADKKDSSNLPALGGILDLVDSLLFNAPILYLYLL